MIRWKSVFGSPTSFAINRTFKRRSLSRTAFTRDTLFSVLEIEGRPFALFVLNALPSVLERHVSPEDLGWRQNSIPISCPQQLQRFGTRFSEFRAELNQVTLLQTPLHFRPWQDTKTTTHFANVPTATKALLRCAKKSYSLLWGQIMYGCHNTDYVHVNGHDRTILAILAKYYTRLPDDGSFVIRDMLGHFLIFYNFNYIYELYICASVG